MKQMSSGNCSLAAINFTPLVDHDKGCDSHTLQPQLLTALELDWVARVAGGGHYIADFAPLHFTKGFIPTLSEKNCKIIFRIRGVEGSKTVWNFSENSSNLLAWPVPYVFIATWWHNWDLLLTMSNINQFYWSVTLGLRFHRRRLVILSIFH